MPKGQWRDEYQALIGLLREVRVALGVTQEELADRLDARQIFVSRCERGERRVDLIDLLKILRALDVHPEDFLEELDRRLATQSGAKVRARSGRSGKPTWVKLVNSPDFTRQRAERTPRSSEAPVATRRSRKK